ncbi:MAG TPA: undecaprenyl-diphosphate phosphatase [Clostridiaceae bacterium]|jgi:undecaprenyl-diphosphatase|nr:undecaprenyl-diphosphate phosphatase [Clostridiaceae bacterium]
MEILHSLILGVVQGLTELLPVSSSAHLNLFPWVFGWSDISESFDVALHIGTLLAIIIFFYKDWVQLIKGGYNQVVKKKKSTEGKIFWYIVIATIPTGIACLVLDKLSGKLIEILSGVFKTSQINTQMFIIAIALIVMGIILYVVDKNSKSKIKYKDITFKQSLLISLSQAIAAAFPGVSRSGITMTVGRKMGVERESVAKFSFLLSTPIVAAAALYELKHFVFDLPFVIGVLASFIVGMFVIKFLLNYLKKGSFKVFAIYRVALGIIVLIILMTRL